MKNNGLLNWNPTTSESKTIIPGYYSGGTISTTNAYNAGTESATLLTKTKSQVVSFTPVQRKNVAFTFDDLTEVYGIVSIKKIAVGTYGYHNQFDVSYDKLLTYVSISGNTVNLPLYSGVDVSSNSTWEVTVIGK